MAVEVFVVRCFLSGFKIYSKVPNKCHVLKLYSIVTYVVVMSNNIRIRP
jgi:hypothetical protein